MHDTNRVTDVTECFFTVFMFFGKLLLCRCRRISSAVNKMRNIFLIGKKYVLMCKL